VVPIQIIETTYHYLLKTVFAVANPIKKRIIHTDCKIHKALNSHALVILENDKFRSEFNFFISYLSDLNKGTVWADQDFKSSNHFYNPYRKRVGLYGRKNALEFAVDYYREALQLWRLGEFHQALFYFGAVLHLIQDMTIPQHANIRLLDDHRQYETYIKRTYQHLDEFHVEQGAYLLRSVESYIRFNARVAIKIHKRYGVIKDDETRFYYISKCAIPLAKRTTAGAMVLFYKDIMHSSVQ
jgi:phospholipase C